MIDTSKYPDELSKIILSGIDDIDKLMDLLISGLIDVDEWGKRMLSVLSVYHSTAYMVGAGIPELNDSGREYIEGKITEQKKFLDGFIGTISDSISNESKADLPWGMWKKRAEMYVPSVVSSYYEGDLGSLPLPAMPGDGTSQCLNFCKCHWEIVPIDADNGDFDCFWRMGTAEHCQTCQERARRWNPLKVRGFELELYDIEKERNDFAESFKSKFIEALKGGKGSGNFRHSGRPGKIGGSQSSDSVNTVIENKNFMKWFGDSKVIDDSGKPMVVYHGTDSNFDKFNRKGDSYLGIYFSADQSYAKEYGGKVMPVYLRIENPFVINLPDEFGFYGAIAIDNEIIGFYRELEENAIKTLKSKGYDGIIVNVNGELEGRKHIKNPFELVVFDPNQIKSSNSNSGTYSESPSIFKNRLKGGKGSGNFGHSGRPGKVGGSSSDVPNNIDNNTDKKLFSLASKVANKIHRLPTEKILAYIDGKEVFSKSGGQDSIAFDDDEMKKMKGSITFHNHPGGWDFSDDNERSAGSAFSVEDLSFIDQTEMAEMWVIARKKVYRMQSMGKFYPPREHVGVIQMLEGNVYRDFLSRIDRKRMTIDQAEASHNIELSKRVAEAMGWKFTEYPIEQFISPSETSKEHETTAIVCFDAKDIKPNDKLDGLSETVDDHHVTLVFLGKTDELDKKDLLNKLETFSGAHAPITGKLSGYAVFSREEDSDVFPVVKLLDSPELPAFRQALMKMCGYPEQDHGFTAHMTLGYTESNGFHLPSPKDIDVTFDKLSLWFGDEHFDFLLSGKNVEKETALKGGEGSGNFGHAGRPGKIGGSAPSDGIDPVSRAIENKNFVKWFGDSKIVDDNGKPMVVYHGTPSRSSEMNNRYAAEEIGDVEFADFDTFDTSIGGITDSGWLGRGSYFTPDPGYAEEFGNIIKPVFLRVEKPFMITDDNSNGYSNSFEFRRLLSELNLPSDLNWIIPNTSMPEDITEGEYKSFFEVKKGKDADGNDMWFMLGYNKKSGENDRFSFIEAEGKSREEAISAYNDKHSGYRNMYDDFTVFISSLIREIGASRFTQILKDNGFDGVMSFNADTKKLSEIVVFQPNQIKSAIGNSGEFDINNPSITKEMISSMKGGDGSGNFDHAGRPGKVGGSAPNSSTDYSLISMDAMRAINEYASNEIRDYSDAVKYYEKLLNSDWGTRKISDHLDGKMTYNHYGDWCDAKKPWATASDKVRSSVKKKIVDSLYEELGKEVDKETLSAALMSWAGTSNDHSYRSLSLQEAAAEEFGFELSDWQKNNLKKSKEDFDIYNYVKNNPDKLPAREITESAAKKFGHNVEVIESIYATIDTEDIAHPGTNKATPIASRDVERKILRAMYNLSQKTMKWGQEFTTREITATLYRGCNNIENISFKDIGRSINYIGNALESWSVSPAVAAVFGNTVIAIQVPVSKILCTARTGLGCLTEGEVVTMGLNDCIVKVIDVKK